MIKVYSAKVTDFTQADYTKQYSLLDCALRERIDAKRIADDKTRSLAGYILLYRGARELYNKADFSVSFNEHGKPLCDFCYFSISHSAERVVCAFCDEPIGIDIQKIKPVNKREHYHFFNSAETDYANADENSIDKRFTEIFTKKESAVKMLGGVLADSRFIDTFSNNFHFETQIQDGFITTLCRKKL